MSGVIDWKFTKHLLLDYDLCTPCISAGISEVHNPFHEFFDINEPGRVIVHTVFSGDGERENHYSPTARASTTGAPALSGTEESVIHFANCNLCDSRIRGDRYVSFSWYQDQLQIVNSLYPEMR